MNNAAVQIAKPLWRPLSRNGCGNGFKSPGSVSGGKISLSVIQDRRKWCDCKCISVHAVATSANISAYAASKGGMLALTRALAIEFAPDDIRVNAILPGAVDTPMLHAGLSRGHFGAGSLPERLENLASKTVIGRVGKPEEIAHAIYFLADETQSSFMTGQALIIDGGATGEIEHRMSTYRDQLKGRVPASFWEAGRLTWYGLYRASHWPAATFPSLATNKYPISEEVQECPRWRTLFHYWQRAQLEAHGPQPIAE